MSYITSNTSKGVLTYDDAGYVIEIEDEEYYNQSTSDSKYLHLDGSQAMSSNLDMGSNKITNVVDPTDAQEASTKNYIDSNYYDQSTSDNRYLLRIGGNTMSDNLVFESGATVILNDFAMDAQFNQIANVADPTSAQDATNLQYLQNNYYDQSTSDGKYLHLDGSQAMSSNLDMGSNKISSVVDPSTNQDVATKNYVDSNHYNQSTADNKYLHLDGSKPMTSDLDMGSNKITNVNDPSNNKDAVNLQYYNSNLPSVVYRKEKLFGESGSNPFSHSKVTVNAGSSDNPGVSFTMNGNKPVYVHAFAQIWKDSADIIDTDVKLRIIADFSAGGEPTSYRNYPRDFTGSTLPNIPGDSDTIYLDHSEALQPVDTVDVDLFISNNHTSAQDYKVIIFAEVFELHSLTIS